MHVKMLQRLLDNNNAESFLPQNLSLNILHYMLKSDEEFSTLLVTYAAAVLFKERFNIPLETSLKDATNSKLFESCFRKYNYFILQEYEYRVKYYISYPVELTIDNIFFNVQ